MTKLRILLLTLALGITIPLAADSQNLPAPDQAVQLQPPPPATKLEGFRPAAGTVLTVGYDELGGIVPGFVNSGSVLIKARQLDDGSSRLRGITVTVTENQFRKEVSFIDEDELAELIRGTDMLLETKTNPTGFRNFEVRYTTKGELELTAFNDSKGEIQFAIQTGRVVHATRILSRAEFQKVRAMFQAAVERFSAP